MSAETDSAMQTVARKRRLDIDLDALRSSRAGLVLSLEERIERFCMSAPLEELKVVFHSTGVNYAHQFYVLSLFGEERLRRLQSVHFVSGSVIAAIVFYSHHTGNLLYGRGDGKLWEQLFFAAHGLGPLRSALRLPLGVLRGSPVLCSHAQMDVIKSGIGHEFGDQPVSFFPPNFHFWLYDTRSSELMCATPRNHLSSIKLVELAIAATAVPRLFHPFEFTDFRFVDPVFSQGRELLAARLREASGPTLVSNMLIERVSGTTKFVRPHLHAHGKVLMARELLKFCLGIPNEDHVAGLEIGLVALNAERE